MLTIYGHPVTDLSNARIVSQKEAKQLILKAKEDDKVRIKHGLEPTIKV